MKKIIFLILLISSYIFANVNYNVFVKMDDVATRNVQSISKGLNKQNISTLYDKGYQIHVTLYLTEYKKEALDKIKNVVDDVAKIIAP